MGTTVQRYRLVDGLKFLLTVGIVFRHAELLGELGRSAAFDGFDRLVMGATEVCVPLFFVLSGFLYFRNTPPQPGIGFFLGKLRSRLFSLLLPYLIANALAFAVYWAAYRWAPQLMSGFLGENWKNPIFVFWTGPVNLSLWFVRDLLIAVIFAPLTWLLVRYTRVWGVLALAVVCHVWGMRPGYNLYFVIGAWLALWRPCWVAAADDWLARRNIRTVPASGQAWCFFIYLYHYLFVLALKKLLPLWIAPQGFWGLLGTYLLVAVLTLALLTGLYALLQKTAPKLLQFLTGGKR